MFALSYVLPSFNNDAHHTPWVVVSILSKIEKSLDCYDHISSIKFISVLGLILSWISWKFISLLLRKAALEIRFSYFASIARKMQIIVEYWAHLFCKCHQDNDAILSSRVNPLPFCIIIIRRIIATSLNELLVKWYKVGLAKKKYAIICWLCLEQFHAGTLK